MRTGIVIGLCCLAGAPAAGSPPKYRIVDLTEIAAPLGVAQSEARAVNEAGQIAGFEVVDLAIEKAIYWDTDLTPSIPARLPGDNSSIATGMDAGGRALGLSEHVTINMLPGGMLQIIEVQTAVRWSGGAPTALASLVTGGPAIRLRFAQDANAHGQIVGWGDVPGTPPMALEFKGFLLDAAGVVTDLGPLTAPTAINDQSQIAGYSRFGQDKAYVWAGGVATSLHHASFQGPTSRAWDLNNAGLIVGEGQFSLSSAEEPTLWTGGVPVRLTPVSTRVQGVASAINGPGQVVGWYKDLTNLNEPFHAFLWQGGQRTKLLELIAPGQGWEVLFPFDINDRGVIVGGARRNGTLGHAFVMYPVCYPDCNADGMLNLADFGCFQTFFALQDPYADCNGDGVLNLADFGCFQTKFALGCP